MALRTICRGTFAVAAMAALMVPFASAQDKLRNPKKDTLVPQTALSLCPALEVGSRESVPAGTALAVSADGIHRDTWLHTTTGAALDLRNRDTGVTRRIELVPPPLPPGVTWRVQEAEFSPDGSRLAVRSTGAIWVIDTQAAHVLFLAGVDAATQTYPGKMSWGGKQLAIVFWPVESYLADATAQKPVAVRIYDGTSGQVTRTLQVQLPSSNAWTEPRLSPDGSRVAVLVRANHWPGKAVLMLLAAETGKPVWENKISAEDLQWTSDGKQLMALGSELVWLDSENGKEVRQAGTSVAHSENQKLRVSEAAHTAAGKFSVYSPFKRMLKRNELRETRVVLWQLDTGKGICEIPIAAANSVDAWPTARDELISLEETYDVRPPLRLLKSAQIVTYQISKPAAPAKPAKP
jgi:hypothetical protein